MRLSRTIATALVLSLALAACVPGNVQRSPDEIAAMQQAQNLAKQGQFDQAAQAWMALAGQSRNHADSYRLMAAEAWREEGQLQRAAPVLPTIRRQRLNGDEPVRLDLLQAELALDQHDAAMALHLTSQPNVTVPATLQLRLLELRARAMLAGGDIWGAARTRVQMDDDLSGLDQSQNRQQVLDLLGKLGVGQLKQRADAMTAADRMLPWVNEALSQLGVAVAQATPELQQPVGTLLPDADANVREGYKVPAKIALLLPEGGGYATASSSIREGFLAAYLDAARNHAPRPAIRIYDSTGTGEGAVKAYQQAVNDGAGLVIGPLTRSEVATVFDQPQLPVPLLALNHPDDRQLPGGNTSEFGLLPEAEGSQAADHMADRGVQQVYVLISTDDFAQRAANAFKAELEARGGKVAGSLTLPPGVSSYADAITGMRMPSSNASTSDEGAIGGDTGIFISMRPAQARLLLPQLRIARIMLPVFATSHVYAGTDDAASNRDLDGVEFCDSPWLFDAQPGLPDRDDIAARLSAARGAAARLFAFGMDAWNLAPYIDWLRAHPGSYLPGATGQLTADQFGRVRRVLIWARFQNGLARPLAGGLQLDDMPPQAPDSGVEPASLPPANDTDQPH